MAKKLNKSVVGLLTAFTFVLVTTVGVIAMYSLKQDDPQLFVERAEQALANDDYEQALNYYRRAYGVSEDPAYLVPVGDMSYALGNEQDASNAWRHAITLKPVLVDGHERLLKLRLEISNLYSITVAWLRVKERAEALLAIDGQEENAMALYGLGSSLIHLSERDGGDRSEGIRLVRRGAALAPDEVEYGLSLVWLLKEDDQTDEAEAVLKQLVAGHQEPGENASKVRYSYGRFLAIQKRFEEAEEQYASAMDLAGGGIEELATAKSQFSNYWIGRWFQIRGAKDNADTQKYYGNAKRLLEESIAINENGFLQYMLLSELSANAGRHDVAVEICRTRIEKEIIRKGLKRHQQKQALYMLELKASEESLAHAQSFDTNSPEYMAQVKEAERYAEMAQAEIPDRGPALHVIGKIRFGQGLELEAIEYLQRAREAFGKADWKNNKLLAQMLLRNNQPGAAKEVIMGAVEVPGADLSCWLTLGEVLLATKEYTAAVRAADDVLRRAPGTVEADRIRMVAYRESGQNELADLIESRLFANSPEAILKKAERLFESKRYEDAMGLLRRVLETNPGNVSFVRAAVMVLKEMGNDRELKSLLARAIETNPDALELKMIAIEVDGALDEVEKQAKRLEVIKEIDEPFQRHYRLALTYQSGADFGKANEHLALALDALSKPDCGLDVLTKRRFERDVVERQFTLAVAGKAFEDVDSIVEMAVMRNLDGADGLIFRGRSYMARKDAEQALDSFKLAMEKQPTNANLLTLLGQAHMMIDPPRTHEAETYFQQAIDSNPNIGSAHKGVAVVALQRGDRDRYKTAIRKCAELIPNDPWVQKRMLSLQEESTPLEAIERREKIRAQEPTNNENLLDLAKLYTQTDQPEKAGECYDTLLANGNASGRTTLIAAMFFREQGLEGRAKEILQAYIDRQESNCDKANAMLLLAEHHFVLGHVVEAEKTLGSASDLCVTTDVGAAFAVFFKRTKQFEDAVRWYDRAIVSADEEGSERAETLRRERIEVHFRGSDNEAAQSAIDEYITRFPDDPNGLLLQCNLNTVLGDIDKAITFLDRFLEKFPLNLNAKLQRARLYGAQGRWPRAIQDLEQIRSNDPNHRNYASRILLADAYSLVNELTSAYSELESILRDDPSAKQVASHLIELYYEHERYNDAIRVCTGSANRFPDDPVWLKSRADVRDKVGDIQAAINDYQRAVALSGYNGRYASVLLGVYSKHDRVDEGISYYEQKIPTDSRGPFARMRYGELLAKSGRYNEAVVEMLAAFDGAEFREAALINAMVNAIVDSFGIDRAIGLFQEADPPKSGRAARHVSALLLTRNEQYSESIATMQSLLQTSTSDSERMSLLSAIGNVHEQREDWASAQHAYEQLLEIDDRHVIGLNNLAYLLSDKLSKPREAVPYARRAALLYGVATVRDTLGWTLVQLGEFREAIAILTSVLETNPRFIPATYHLAEAYRRDGDSRKAYDLLEGAMNLINDGADDQYKDKIRKRLDELAKE